ncbi:MAG: hypothetical protein U5K54_08060 [Cytophagales bacterium]|nr:hypothetical protein [Cytophagales bacterium]
MKIELDFMVGESFTGEFWDLSIHKAERNESVSGKWYNNLKSKIKPTEGNNVLVKADQEGTYLFLCKAMLHILDWRVKSLMNT